MATRGSKNSTAGVPGRALSPSPDAGPLAAVDALAPEPIAKPGRVRDDYSFSQLEVAQIDALKRRAAEFGFVGSAAKKNALLSAGVAALAMLTDEQLRAVLGGDATPKEDLSQR